MVTVSERVATLEAHFETINKRGERLEDGIQKTREDVQEIKDMINRGKGAWWVGVGAIGAATGYLGTWAHKVFHL